MDWRTPVDLFKQLDLEFDFTLDAAATKANALCPCYLGPDHPREGERDGLVAPWSTSNFCNPEYGRGIGRWVLKAQQEQVERNATSVLLVPARTDTQWWKHAQSASEIRFIEGRLKFWMPITIEFDQQVEALQHDLNPKAIAAKLKVPLVAVEAALEGKTIAEEAAPFPSALLVFKGWRGAYRWWCA